MAARVTRAPLTSCRCPADRWMVCGPAWVASRCDRPATAYSIVIIGSTAQDRPPAGAPNLVSPQFHPVGNRAPLLSRADRQVHTVLLPVGTPTTLAFSAALSTNLMVAGRGLSLTVSWNSPNGPTCLNFSSG